MINDLCRWRRQREQSRPLCYGDQCSHVTFCTRRTRGRIKDNEIVEWWHCCDNLLTRQCLLTSPNLTVLPKGRAPRLQPDAQMQTAKGHFQHNQSFEFSKFVFQVSSLWEPSFETKMQFVCFFLQHRWCSWIEIRMNQIHHCLQKKQNRDGDQETGSGEALLGPCGGGDTYIFQLNWRMEKNTWSKLIKTIICAQNFIINRFTLFGVLACLFL